MTSALPWSARWRFAAILVAVISVNTAYTVLIPLVPQIERHAGLTESGISLVFAIYAGAKAVAQPLGGLWADRWPVSRVAGSALLVIAICVYLMGAARNPAGVLAARAGWGIGAGLLTPALYKGTAELSARYDVPVSRSMAWFGVAAVTGLLLGPAFAAVAAGLGLSRLCTVCAAITIATCLSIYPALSEPSKIAVRPPADGPAAAPVPRRAWLTIVLLFGTLDLLTNLAYSGLEPTIPLYLTPPAPWRTSVVFMLGMGTFAVVSWLLGRQHSRLGSAALIVLGGLIGVVGFAGFSIGSTVWTVAPSMVIVMISQPLLYLAARWGTAELRESGGPVGLAFGIFGSISDVGYMLGPLVGVALVDAAGRAGFAIVGLIGALGMLTARPVARRGRRTGEASW